jgi:hypothetical protein
LGEFLSLSKEKFDGEEGVLLSFVRTDYKCQILALEATIAAQLLDSLLSAEMLKASFYYRYSSS